MSCQKCSSMRIASVGGKCSDCSWFVAAGKEHNGYVPGGVGIGSGDYIELTYCLDCGQIQGDFPISPDVVSEVFGEDSEDYEGENDYE